MTANSTAVNNTTFKIGWWLLIGMMVYMTLNLFNLIRIMPNELYFILGWIGLHIYGLVVLWIPFRENKKWAWYTTWLLPLINIGAYDSTVGIYYVVSGIILAVGLFLTKPAFD